jgi:type I restriction enzyme, S subunit
VGRSGASIGVVNYICDDYWPLNTCLYGKNFHGNSPRFVYYFLKTLDLARLNSGSAQPSLNRNFVHPVPVVFPQRPEQDAIASVLSALDDKIGLNRRMNETLEAMARAIFKDWFVDFGPTRAKMEKQQAYLASEFWSLFPDRLDNHGKPEGWELVRLGDVGDLNWGDTNTTKASYVGDGYKAFSAAGPDGFLSYADFDRAKCGQTWFTSGKWSCIKNTIRFWSTDPSVSDEYLYQMTYDGSFWPKRGSAQPFISQTDARNCRLIKPGRMLARIYGDVSGPLFDKASANEKENRALAQTRDLLLPKLMSGEIRVKDAEKVLGEVA